MMISRLDLENLLKHESQTNHPMLSVYLDVNQSRAVNLNRGFVKALKTMLRGLEPSLADEQERKAFAENADRVLGFVSDYKPSDQSLVLFSDRSTDLFWSRELRVPLYSRAYWRKGAYVRPLLEVLREYERYGVILTDRAHARLFTVFLGEIEEHREALAPANVRQIKKINTDRIWSQTQVQHKVDQHAHAHLKRVAELMDHVANLHEFDRLVLAGPVEATSELYHLLSKRLRARWVESVPLPAEANESQVLDATLKIEQDVERAREITLIEELVTAAAKKERAAVGLDATLDALQKKQIWRLIYIYGFTSRGVQCTNCASLFAEGRTACAYCESAVVPVDDLVERVITCVIDMDGKIEPVQGAAAERLHAVGGIGAFLRF